MSGIKKILVPTDFSEEANNAMHVAATIAGLSGAEITLLHVVDVPEAAPVEAVDMLGVDANTKEPDATQHYMARLMNITRSKVDSIREEYPAVKINGRVEFDSLQKQLAGFVVKNETDLIVIGSKGSGGLDEILVGSNAEKVIRMAKAPVLTVKSRMEELEIKEIVFASNFRKVSKAVVDSLKDYQRFFHARLHFVKIITPNTFEAQTDTEKIIGQFAREHDFTNYTVNVYNYYTEEEGIRMFGDRIGADLLSMITHGRTGLAHLFLGSIAEEVANHSMLPVLTFNQHFNQ